MRPVTVLTDFVQQMSALVDAGYSASIDEVQDHIEDETLIPWLQEKFPFKDTYLDFSLYKPEKEIPYLHGKLLELNGGYRGDERRKWGIQKNGLCLLISWGTELIRYMPGVKNQKMI